MSIRWRWRLQNKSAIHRSKFSFNSKFWVLIGTPSWRAFRVYLDSITRQRWESLINTLILWKKEPGSEIPRFIVRNSIAFCILSILCEKQSLITKLKKFFNSTILFHQILGKSDILFTNNSAIVSTFVETETLVIRLSSKCFFPFSNTFSRKVVTQN